MTAGRLPVGYNPPRMNGFFLTVEGVEGSGKSTQLQRLAEHLRAAGSRVVVTREPGGTPLADRIRAILLDPRESGIDAMTELLLYAASRRQHVVEVILPSLQQGAVVICDRFTDATLAYQGYGRRLPLDRLETLNEWATDGLEPALTLVYDVAEAVGLERAQRRNDTHSLQEESRFEQEELAFHRRVREGYLSLALARPQRYAVIDATDGIDAVFARTLEIVASRAPQLLHDGGPVR